MGLNSTSTNSSCVMYLIYNLLYIVMLLSIMSSLKNWLFVLLLLWIYFSLPILKPFSGVQSIKKGNHLFLYATVVKQNVESLIYLSAWLVPIMWATVFFPPCSHLTIFGPLWDQKRLYLKHPMHPHHKLAKSETFHLCWKGRKIWSDIPERSCRMDWLKHCSNNRSNTKNEFNNLNNSLNRFSSMIIIFNLYVQFM